MVQVKWRTKSSQVVDWWSDMLGIENLSFVGRRIFLSPSPMYVFAASERSYRKKRERRPQSVSFNKEEKRESQTENWVRFSFLARLCNDGWLDGWLVYTFWECGVFTIFVRLRMRFFFLAKSSRFCWASFDFSASRSSRVESRADSSL